MPGSEKPAKKAAKKTTAKKAPAKRPAKKAAKKVETTPVVKKTRAPRTSSKDVTDVELNEEATEVLGEQPTAPVPDYDVQAMIEAARGRSGPILTGITTVRLVDEYEDAAGLTPSEAVQRFMNNLAFVGMQQMIFIVVDEDAGEVYAVRGTGEVVGLD